MANGFNGTYFKIDQPASSTSTGYISCGGGYTVDSGCNGVKIACTDQSDALTGLGQDISGNSYTLSIVTSGSTSTNGRIEWVQHTNREKSYRVWAYLTSSGFTSPGYYIDSSRKLKNSIEKTKCNALDILNSVEVVDFFYNSDINKERPKIGFIAEDVPEILSGPNKDKMDTNNCIGMLIKAVQELSAKVSVIENKQ